MAQIPEVKERKKCYEKYDSNGNVISASQRRYAEWQCGKLAGVVDCNEKLSYDQDRDMVFTGNHGKPFTGKCETCHRNGTIARRVSFVGGKQNGIDTTYYESGCPQVIQSHVQGAPNGQWLYYNDSTNYLAWEMNYYLGKPHGKHIFYKQRKDENGEYVLDTTRWENYSDSLLHGTKRTYYRGSKIKTKSEYDHGLLNGHFEVFNLEGIAIQDVNYKQGKKDEEAKYYYDDGTLLKTESWDSGVKNGDFKMFYYQGHEQVSESYKKGVPIGWWTEYYPDATTKRRVLYDKKGKRIEEHKYDEQGRETYAFGTPDSTEAEDDAMPGEEKKKKRKKKKR